MTPRLAALAACALVTAAAAPAAAAPDLVVTNLVLLPAGAGAGDGTLRATLKNVGTSDVDLSITDYTNVAFYRNGVLCGDGIIGDLGVGESEDEDVTSCNPSKPGTYEIIVVVDAGDSPPSTFPAALDDDVAESNEANNSLAKSFTWTGPDLVVTAVTLSPDPAKYGEGTVTATVKNQGPIGTGLVNLDVEFFRNGAKCGDGLILGGLGAGATATEDVGSCNPSTPGTYTIEARIDTTKEVDETDENNNARSASLTWLGPDLVITGVALTPDPAKAGEGTLTATVANIGAFGTGIFVNLDVTMYLDGVECDTGYIIAGLDAGATATEETTKCNPTSGGKHTVTFVVDSTEEVIETNELNNVWEGELEWFLPDLVITNLVFEGDKLEPGKSNTFTATIANQGVVDTDSFLNIDVAMRLDGQLCDDGIIIAGLGAGKTAQESTSKCNPGTPGPHVIRFEVDSTFEVAEADEGNNFLEKTFVFCGDQELCNGLDDDCDGETDEGFDEVGDPCDGPDADVCETGTWVCKANGSGVECQESGGSVELCNGQDDDCDGQTDEEWPLLGVACDGPDPDDCASGAWVCKVDGTGVECLGDGKGGAEQCNGIDDDCDGQTDEDFDVGAACQVQAGGCTATGKKVCNAAGTGTECSAAAGGQAEACNGKDDDCDGQTDEDFPELGAACTVGVGACQVVGAYACGAGGGEPVCAGMPGSPGPQEICGNAVDDDCDGVVDEGCGCVPGGYVPCGSNVGECVTGAQACGADGKVAGACAGAVGPVVEACNGKDDDCDGSVDEGCACTDGATRDCAPDSGICKAGEQTCEGGAWGACEGAQAFEPEACDLKDNDCDGETDEGCPCSPGESRLCPDPPEPCALYERFCDGDGVWSACLPVPGTEQPGCGGPGPSDDTGGGGSDAGGADTGGAPDAGGFDTAGVADVPGVLLDVPGGSDGTTKAKGDGCAGGGAGAPWWLGALALLGLRRRRGALEAATRQR